MTTSRVMLDFLTTGMNDNPHADSKLELFPMVIILSRLYVLPKFLELILCVTGNSVDVEQCITGAIERTYSNNTFHLL